MSRRASNVRNTDWLTIFLYLGLVATGWLMIYATNYSPDDPTTIYDTTQRHGNQLIWIGLSLVAGLFAMVVDSKFYRAFAIPLYGIVMLLLVGVLLFGQEVAGARSWFNIGFFKFQPSEFGKLAACLALASYLSRFNTQLDDDRVKFMALGIIGLPMLLILLQPDAGSALVYASFLILLFREGMPPTIYVLALIFAIISIVALIFPPLQIAAALSFICVQLLIANFNTRKIPWLLFSVALAVIVYLGFQYPIFKSVVLVALGLVMIAMSVHVIRIKKPKIAYTVLIGLIGCMGYSFAVSYVFNDVFQPHQQDRINVWLQPSKCDPLGSLYNLNQSKLAISSGGLDGKGFLNGRITQLNYVPEQSTDFIFCTVGEEHGFLGSFGLIILFLGLLLRIIFIAERQRSSFSRMYGYGVAGIIFFHFFINIGMTMGLVPIIGIPLPFISYGGSSLISFTLLIAVLIKLDSVRMESI